MLAKPIFPKKVFSAQYSFTSVFEMDTGGTCINKLPANYYLYYYIYIYPIKTKKSSNISTSRLNTLLYLHLKPINLVVS